MAEGRTEPMSGSGSGRIRIEPGEAAPGRLVALELSEALRPAWLEPSAAIPFWLARRRGAASARGTVLARFVDGADAWPAIVESDEGVTFLFDPDEAIAAIQNETYFQPHRPLHTHVSLPYQYVPGEVRLRVFRWLVKPQAPAAGFPAWPHDASVDAMRWAFTRAQSRADGVSRATPSWPKGKRAAFTISHDVDTAAGVRRIPETAAFEEAAGVRSCWYVVGDLFEVDPPTLQALAAGGHEIGLHGDRHDNTIAYRPPEEIERRLAGCAEWMRRYDMRGFRSPSLLETPALRDALRRRFSYASQVPDSEVYSLIGPRRGCATSFPFLRHGLLEIPITLPMEDKLIMQGMNEAQILDLWRGKAAAVKEVGGVIQLAIHNEPHLLRRCRGAYEQLVRELAADRTLWQATTAQIADWWTAKDHGNA
jgi:hypothetical protein